MPVRNIVIVALTAIIAISCHLTASRTRLANLFAESLEVIERESLIVSDRQHLFDAAMNGMLHSLDPHSQFISGREYQDFQEEFKQEFGGVGMYTDIDPSSGKLTILAPMKDRPAGRAGLRAGDVLLKIDGESTEGMSRLAAIDLMRGPPGSAVSIEYQRGEAVATVTLQREVIPTPSVHGDWINRQGQWEFTVEDHPHLGYIRVSLFANQTSTEFRNALRKIKGKVAGVIVDLRNNSGGLLTSAVEIADQLLSEGLVVVQTKDRDDRVMETFQSTAQTELADKLPVVVLINRHSASASEIVAAAWQDHIRATVVGEQSYGKGTVQNVIPLERGRSAMKLTVARYARPSNRNIDRDWARSQNETQWGVLPNPGFELVQTDADVFENYRRRLMKEINGLNAAQAESDPPVFNPPASAVAPTIAPNAADDSAADNEAPEFVDLPLQRAIEFLNSITVRTVSR